MKSFATTSRLLSVLLPALLLAACSNQTRTGARRHAAATPASSTPSAEAQAAAASSAAAAGRDRGPGCRRRSGWCRHGRRDRAPPRSRAWSRAPTTS